MHLFALLSLAVLAVIYFPKQEAHLVVDPLPKGTLLSGHKQAPVVESQFRLVETQLHSEGLFLFLH